MLSDLEKFKKSWDFHRGHTLDLLKTLSDEDLEFSVGKSMGTLGKQFRHLCRVDDQYISAISNGKVENNRKKLEVPLEKSKDLLLEQFKVNDKRLKDIISNVDDDVKIDWSYWGEEEFSLTEHLEAMLEHEILHHGELIVYFRVMNKKFPDSWKAWGV